MVKSKLSKQVFLITSGLNSNSYVSTSYQMRIVINQECIFVVKSNMLIKGMNSINQEVTKK